MPTTRPSAPAVPGISRWPRPPLLWRKVRILSQAQVARIPPTVMSNRMGIALQRNHLYSADSEQQSSQPKKVPYAKPIPKSFQQSWNEVGALTASSDGQQAFSQAPPPMGGPPPGQFPHAPPGMLPPPGPDCIPLQGRLPQIASRIKFDSKVQNSNSTDFIFHTVSKDTCSFHEQYYVRFLKPHLLIQ